MPLLNYPDVCTAPTCGAKAFCKEHCLVVEAAGYPSDIRGFLKACTSKSLSSGKQDNGRIYYHFLNGLSWHSCLVNDYVSLTTVPFSNKLILKGFKE